MNYITFAWVIAGAGLIAVVVVAVDICKGSLAKTNSLRIFTVDGGTVEFSSDLPINVTESLDSVRFQIKDNDRETAVFFKENICGYELYGD